MASAFKKLKKLFPWRKKVRETVDLEPCIQEGDYDHPYAICHVYENVGPIWFIPCKTDENKTTDKDKTVGVEECIYANANWPAVFEISRSELTLTRKITENRLVEIHEGVVKFDIDSNETSVAVKTTKSDLSASTFEKYDILTEAEIMINLDSHHVVKLIGMITVQEPFCVITELMAFGDLKSFLRSHDPEFQEYNDRGRLSPKHILQMCGEIADGMAYLSSKNIVHRDLAARNCLVGEDMTVKIGGLHKFRVKKKGEDSVPIRWMAPESLTDGTCTMKSNAWSYGVLLWEIATLGRHPYHGLTNDEVVHDVSGGRTMDTADIDLTKVRSLMNMCWKSDPSERPTFLEIIKSLEPDLDENFQHVSYFHSDDREVPEEFLRDPYVLELYRKALKEGKENDRSIRINIVGNFGHGKTSLVRRLVGESIEEVKSTNGIDIDRYTCTTEKDGTFSYVRKDAFDNVEVGNRLVLVAQATDMQQERKNSIDIIEPPFCEKSELQGLQDSPKTTVIYERNTDPAKSFEPTAPPPPPPVIPVSVPKPKMYATERRQSSIKRMNTDFKIFKDCLKSRNTPTKEKDIPVSFDIWDFGGQDAFYATHTIFHSRKAIYLLVFNLSLDLHERVKDEDEDLCLFSRYRDMAYYIRFWMNSIHSFVGNEKGTEPPVIFVGTHKDKVLGSKQSKQNKIERQFCDVRDIFEEPQVINHIRPEEFAVDNTDSSDQSVLQLREALIQLGEEKSKTLTVPAKWIQLEKCLIQVRTKKIISLETVMKLNAENEFPLVDTEQVKLFLKYHHNKGTFCYFDEEPISDDVVLDPQYLIDAFKCIITSGNFCKKDIELRNFWKKLLKEAKLEHTLIDRVWGRDKDKGFLNHKSTLIAFLKKHHVISEATRYDSTKQSCEGLGWYLVPSLLRNKCSENEIKEFLHGKQHTLTRYVLKFESITVVPTIYHRVIAAALGMWPVAQFQGVNLIYENLSVLRLDVYHDGLIEMNDRNIELSVVSLCPSVQVSAEVADKLRRFVESVVEHEFSKLRDTAEDPKKPYVTTWRCNHPSHGLSGSIDLIEMIQLEDRKILPCPDAVSHELVIEKFKSEWIQDSRYLQNIPDQQLHEKCISTISRAVGRNWELLGIELGLTDVEIQHIAADNPSSVIMRIYKMLTKWNRKYADRATMGVLVQAMQNCSEVCVDWDIIRNVIDEMV